MLPYHVTPTLPVRLAAQFHLERDQTVLFSSRPHLSACCAVSLFLSSAFYFPLCFFASYNLPYILPSSVCSNPFLFALFTKLPGCTRVLPKMERPFNHERKLL